MAKLTEKCRIALQSLRDHVESGWHGGDTDTWGQVYLDNAIPEGWSGRTWAGVLSALERRGLYRPQGDQAAFGDVKLKD